MAFFESDKVIKTHNIKDNLCTYYVDFDINDDGIHEYRLKSLINVLSNVIPEFAYGHHEGTTTDNNDMVKKIGEAAQAIYKIKSFSEVDEKYSNSNSDEVEIEDKYLKRGEFGELILHLLLRDFHNTIPLISKIYFKDSFGSTVHGFDAIHIEESTKSLWLGESKLYTDGKDGVSALIKDLKDHFTHEYLDSEFLIVSKKLDYMPEDKRSEWLDLLHKNTPLEEKFKKIKIPLLCTYQCSIFERYNTDKENFIKLLDQEILKLKNHFDMNNNHKLSKHMEIILLLFPVKSKKDLVSGLHKKLRHMQKLAE